MQSVNLPDWERRSSSVAVAKASSFPSSSNPTNLAYSITNESTYQRSLPIFRDTVHKAYNTGKDFDRQLFDQPRYIFYKDSDETSIVIFRSEFLSKFQWYNLGKWTLTHCQMFIHDLTSFKIWMVKVYDTECLSPSTKIQLTRRGRAELVRCHSDDLLLIGNLSVSTMLILLHFFEFVHPWKASTLTISEWIERTLF